MLLNHQSYTFLSVYCFVNQNFLEGILNSGHIFKVNNLSGIVGNNQVFHHIAAAEITIGSNRKLHSSNLNTTCRKHHVFGSNGCSNLFEAEVVGVEFTGVNGNVDNSYGLTHNGYCSHPINSA